VEQVGATRESDTIDRSRSKCKNAKKRAVQKLLITVNKILAFTLLPTAL